MNDKSEKWQPLESCDGLPGKVEDWLAEPGSLTARVRERCDGDFRLQVIDERRVNGARVFDDIPSGNVFQRDITLGCGERPLIFARTRVPEITLHAHPWLAELGNRPLGARLFDEPGYMRGRFYVAQLQASDALYDYVHENVVLLSQTLWARRARVELNGKPFEICECFLPGLI